MHQRWPALNSRLGASSTLSGRHVTALGDNHGVTYEGPSLSEWLAEYRARRPPTEVVLYRATLPEPLVSSVSRKRVAALRISRYDAPDNPRPTVGFYLFSVDEVDDWVSDSWHKTLDDAFYQAEYEFKLDRSVWTADAGDG